MSASSLLSWGVQTSISVSILILFVMIMRKPVTRFLGAGPAYALWALPLLRLVMPAIPILPANPLTVTPVLPNDMDWIEVAFIPVSATPDLAEFSWATLLICVWISGAIIWLARQYFLQAKFSTGLKVIEPRKNSANITQQTSNMAKRLGLKRTPAVQQVDNNSGPLVIGLIRPVIVLPAGFETDFSQEQQTHALAHELSHLKNGDLWIAAIALIFRALNWVNPLVHLAAPLFRADQEAACDARVIAALGNDRSTKTAYADTLIRAAKLSHKQTLQLPLGLTISNPLKERLMILKTNPNQSRSLRFALAGTAAIALFATAPLTLAQTPTPPATPDMTDTMTEKKVLKWVSNDDGVEVSKHVEIITENGATTAWEIDDLGNRMEVSLDSLNMPLDLAGASGGQMRVMMKHHDGALALSDLEIEKMIAGTLDGVDGEHQIIIKRIEDLSALEGLETLKSIEGLRHLEGLSHLEALETLGEQENVIILESHGVLDIETDGENSFVFHSGDPLKSEPGMMVDVASKMLDGVDIDGLDYNARVKVEAAQQALRDAQEALAAAE